MIRSFVGVQSIGAASQPVFGTTMTAAGVMTMDPHTLKTNPASQPSSTLLTVTSTVGFRVGDRVAVGPKANFIYQGTIDKGTVIGVNAGAGTITVEGLIATHASGEYVVLCNDCNRVFVEQLTTTNVKYLGTASTVAAADPSVFFQFNATSGPYDSGYPKGNWQNTIDYWIAGTNADQFIGYYNEV